MMVDRRRPYIFTHVHLSSVRLVLVRIIRIKLEFELERQAVPARNGIRPLPNDESVKTNFSVINLASFSYPPAADYLGVFSDSNILRSYSSLLRLSPAHPRRAHSCS
jgi:hypothetical protein